LGKILENLGKTSENLGKIPENLVQILENPSKNVDSLLFTPNSMKLLSSVCRCLGQSAVASKICFAVEM